VPEKKRHCSLMGANGLQEAIKDYLKKQNTQPERIDEKSIS
jgi:NifU-like protein involved in Fe-S cluster formation